MSTQRGRITVEGFDADAVRERDSITGWEPALQSEGGKGRLHYAWQRFTSNRLALAGGALIALMVVAAVFARPITLPTELPLLVGSVDLPVIGGQTIQPVALAPADPANQNLLDARAPPSLEYLFGTDWAGRDIFSRVIYGGRWSLSIGFIAVGLAVLIGVPLGSIAGYYGDLVDEVIMRVVDTLYAFPFIVLAIAIIAILGRGYWEMILALVLVGWLPYARIIRGEILSVKENEYVLAAKALGARDRTVISRHIVPNAMAPVIVQATLSVGSIVLAAAALGFLGLGLSPGSAEWGTMLQVGRDSLVRGEWWITFFPGFAIFLFVMAINLVGDGVRDAFDPQSDRDVGEGGIR
jgi:peptide/nickel transport system permease protein